MDKRTGENPPEPVGRRSEPTPAPPSVKPPSWNGKIGDAPGLVAELADALRELADIQNGPPLIRKKERWGRAMDAAYRVLAKAEKDIVDD